MQRAHDGEHEQGRGCQIAGKEDGKGSEGYHEHRFAGKRVDHIAAERTYQQGCDGVARQYQSDDILSGAEVLAEVERQQRREHVEGEKQRKVGRHHLAIIPIPEQGGSPASDAEPPRCGEASDIYALVDCHDALL